MNLPSKFGLATAVVALMALIGAGGASATTLEVGGTAQNKSVFIEASIAAGGTIILKDTNNLTVETCKESGFTTNTETPFTGATVTGAVSLFYFEGCSHKETVLKAGKLHFAWTSGTNGTVSSSGAEFTFFSTIFGVSCIAKTGTGTTIGTLTGSFIGNATLDLNGVIPMGACGDANLTGAYTVTTKGLGVVN